MKAYLFIVLLVACQTIPQDKDLYYLHTHSTKLSEPLIAGLHGVKDALFTELVKRPDDSKVLYNLAQVSFLLGEYKRSAMYCRKILRLDIDFDPAKVILAKIFLQQHKLELATILTDQLQNEELRTNLKAQIHIAAGNYAQAIQVLKEKATKYPDATTLHMNLGLLYLKFKQLKPAADAFQQVLQHNREHSGALLHLAAIHAQRGELVAAQTIYRQLMAKRTKDPQLLFNMLVLSKRQQDYQQAANLLAKHEQLLTRYEQEGLHDQGKQFMRMLRKQFNRTTTIASGNTPDSG
ncbi:MAG: tetratricopeptide repeat protein [Pseudomonadota bacterium]|nr:tetratricopeptide repeat protein [Pseudomonadota bacterium]